MSSAAGARARRGRAGFTLVETLVALVLLSVVAVAVFGAVRTGMRVTQAAESRAEHNQEMRVISELLSRTLTGLVPLTTLVAGKRLPHFEGGAQALTLVVEAPPRFRPGGLYEVTFETLGSGDGSQVRMTRRLVHPDLLRIAGSTLKFRSEKPDDERVLVPHGRIEFAYFGVVRAETSPRWHDAWQGERGPPQMVRAAISEQGVAWPEVVARPQVQQPRFQRVRASAFGSEGDDGPLPTEDDGGAETEAPGGRSGDVCVTPQCLQIKTGSSR